MKLTVGLLVLLVAVLAVACTSPSPTPTPAPTSTPTPKTMSFDSLEKAGVGVNTYPDVAPGKATVLPRAYPGAPPNIPHDISALGITANSNPCLGCHEAGVEVAAGHVATKIPQSHYTDLATGEQSDNLVGARYYCLSCHVPRSDETPPVENDSTSE